MTLHDISDYLQTYLEIEAFQDHSANGLQVENSRDIQKIGLAVDACRDAIRKADTEGCNLLIVHHGLYWGRQQLITDYHYMRVRALIEADMALYAVHLPLDAHPEVGHNSQIAQQMGLVDREPFAPYQGRPIGIKGRLASPAPCCQVAEQLEAIIGGNRGLLAFGPEQIRTVGIIAGSATEPELFRELKEQSIDLFVSGEPKHGAYYLAQEFGLNVFYGGHYQTETFGMRALGSHLAEHFRIKTEMIESPCFL